MKSHLFALAMTCAGGCASLGDGSDQQKLTNLTVDNADHNICWEREGAPEVFGCDAKASEVAPVLAQCHRENPSAPHELDPAFQACMKQQGFKVKDYAIDRWSAEPQGHRCKQDRPIEECPDEGTPPLEN